MRSTECCSSFFYFDLCQNRLHQNWIIELHQNWISQGHVRNTVVAARVCNTSSSGCSQLFGDVSPNCLILLCWIVASCALIQVGVNCRSRCVGLCKLGILLDFYLLPLMLCCITHCTSSPSPSSPLSFPSFFEHSKSPTARLTCLYKLISRGTWLCAVDEVATGKTGKNHR